MIDNYIKYVSNGQQRLSDGTLSRDRPQKNTLWLDDLYMSVPPSQMGKLTGDKNISDDAVKQVLQFSQRMFNQAINLVYAWMGRSDESAPGVSLGQGQRMGIDGDDRIAQCFAFFTSRL